MLETEKAYIAGILDGEGSIMLTKFHKNQYPSPCISISSTDIELLTWIKNTTKMGKIIHKKNYNKEKHLDCYAYKVIYNDALTLLEEIQPYLIIKRKKLRTEHILDNYKNVTPRNGKYSNEMKKKKEQFYIDFMAL
ncbi:hypothetical protein K8M07_02715 [Schnuerera sp. xch1]|uniref:LAGLIDADG family homing endonuclease n=1 Tax=Schnuerera sp. xch1 TaxID=2874283 RepID=UPI001CC10D9B|nr:LAGLIDADG family homing endonuclease [Schnuerera sp. xch1]MBZ2174153.1 hypothetical protein [Schnuerera sp. xch1]